MVLITARHTRQWQGTGCTLGKGAQNVLWVAAYHRASSGVTTWRLVLPQGIQVCGNMHGRTGRWSGTGCGWAEGAWGGCCGAGGAETGGAWGSWGFGAGAAGLLGSVPAGSPLGCTHGDKSVSGECDAQTVGQQA